MPNLVELERLAEILGISVAQLFDAPEGSAAARALEVAKGWDGPTFEAWLQHGLALRAQEKTPEGESPEADAAETGETPVAGSVREAA